MANTHAHAERLVLESLLALPEQLRAGYRAGAQGARPLPRKPKQIVYAGMGGSALAAQIFAAALLGDAVPTEIIRDYHLPSWVSKETLVIVVSYSGTTEEAVSAFHAARKKNAMVLSIAVGGTLQKLAQKTHTPFVLLPTESNPSGQPRMGLMLMLGGLLGAHQRMGIHSLKAQRMEQAATRIRRTTRRYAGGGNSTPKAAAAHALKREMLIVGSPASAGIAHAFSNQINETAKTTAHWHLLPELNHHLLEGLQFPSVRTRPLGAIILSFPGESERIEKRRKITAGIFSKMGLWVLQIRPRTKDPLDATLELIAWSSFFAYEVSKKLHVHPTAIPWVDYFKARLKK